MNFKVLVTGANGQLGETIKDLYAIHPLKIDFVFVSKKDLDITSKLQLEEYFHQNKFHFCVNCAAYTNVEQAQKTPEEAFKINAEGVKNLALECKKHEIVLIHISTDYVFDGKKSEPYKVDDIPNPINEYGKSKLAGEEYIKSYLDEYFIIRTSWLYSKKFGNNFYKFIVEKANQGLDLSITTDQTGCPTDTEDLSKYITSFIVEGNKPFGVYHFCNSEPKTWYRFAKDILKENGLFGIIEIKPVNTYKSIAKRPHYSVLG
ncbi:dTDP-4-dehydrorhamnose reductase [Hyunsoonleella aestuarii]|uniref:dTDP-4-dehydrorhamnose reductase n=1 Tax=Hyunsoonleella aestuarii TaxID=912802 RepID=A0ABP8E933_9FLAO|nr:dTDP-4-dehydrorhamnose reductase [Hyunsoonleella aestuarii]